MKATCNVCTSKLVLDKEKEVSKCYECYSEAVMFLKQAGFDEAEISRILGSSMAVAR